MRLLALLFVILFGAIDTARADMITLDLPTTYTPGTSFNVGVGLTPVNNLGLYNVEVVFQTPGPIAGLLTVANPTASSTGYVFASTAQFLGNINTSGNQLRVTLSDFTLASTGPNVVAGVNDRISQLVVTPAANLTTTIQVSIDRTSLYIDDANGGSLLTPGSLPSGSVSLASSNTPVPSPAGVIGLVAALGLLSARRLLKSKIALTVGQ